MKKAFLFLLLLAPLFAAAQNYSPTTPTGSLSFTPTFRYKDHVTDSTRYIWLSVNGKWYPVSTVGLSGGSFLPLSFPSTQKLTTNGFGLKMNGNGKRQLLFDINSTTSDTGEPLGIISFQDTSGTAMDGELKFSRMTFVGPTNAYARYAQNIKLSLDTDINGIPNAGYVVPLDLVADKKMTVNDHNFDIVAKNGSDSTSVHIDTGNFRAEVDNGVNNNGIGVSQGVASIVSQDNLGNASMSTNSGSGGIASLVAGLSATGKTKRVDLAAIGSNYSESGIFIVDDIDNIGLIGDRVFPLSGSDAQYMQRHKVDSLIAAAGGGTTTNPLTAGYGLSAGGTFNGAVARTFIADTTVLKSKAGFNTDYTNLSNRINLKANLASPALTGTPTAPTATVGTNTTQIATTAFVLANSLGASPVPQIIATASPYNIVADGTTDNTTGLAAIETACAAAGGCEVFLPVGAIKTTKLVISSSNQTWVGMGGIIPFGGSTATTTFTTSATTGVFVTISPGVNSIKFKDIAFSCTGTATAGAGLHISNSVGFRMIDCSVNKFFRNVDFRSGYDYKFDGNVFSLPVERNVMIADSAIADAGDGSFVSNWFYSNVTTSGIFQLEWQSGGGPKLVNNKFNGESGTYYGAIHIDAHASTVDFLMANNSIENFTGYGILGTAQTGVTFSTILINGSNQFAGSGFPIYFDASIGGGTLSDFTIGGNKISNSGSHPCITIKNCGTITIGLNNYTGSTPLDLSSNSGNINVKRLTQPINLSGTTPTYDLNKSNYQNLTLSGATTLTLANILNGDTWFLSVTQDATGSRTLSVTGASTIGGGTIDPTPLATSYIIGHQNIITIFSNVAGTFSSLTTTGNSGAATLSGGVLNVPTYTATGLGAVPTARTVAGFPLSGNVSLATLTPGTHLSGSAYDGSTNRTWTTDATATPTASVITAYDANSNLSANSLLLGYTTTATAAGTTTLTVASTYQQFFTGSTTQTVTLPVASTLVLGQQFKVVNNSSGVVTVQSSGANSVQAMAASTSAIFTCILTSGTSAASWSVAYTAVSAGSTTIYSGDGSTVGARVVTLGSTLKFAGNQTTFDNFSGTANSTAVIFTDHTNGFGFANINGGRLALGGSNGVEIGVVSSNAATSTTNPIIKLTTSAMTLNTNISNTPIALTDNNTGTVNVQFGGTHGDGFTLGQNFYVGSATATPFFKIYSAGTGAVSVGGTPVDAGANNLYVQGTARVAGLTASKVVFTDASKNLTSTGIGTSSQYIAGDGSLGTLNSKPHTIFTPTTGGTVTLTNNQYNIINPAGALLALTVTLPSSPANNDCVFIKYTQAVTTVTYSGGTIVDGVVSPAAGGVVILVFDSGSSSWY